MTKGEIMILLDRKTKKMQSLQQSLILDSKHYESCGIIYHLDAYNAYDDKGNKIEGGYVTLIKKEYDNK